MIDVKELRQGNWVLEDGEYHDIEFQYGDYWHTENFEPIPLTPEILEQCGFEKRIDDILYLQCLFFNDCLYIDNQDGYGLPLEHIKYLHQLQNTFFSLTGEELNFQPHDLFSTTKKPT